MRFEYFLLGFRPDLTNERQKFSERLNKALDIAGFPPKGRGRQLKLASLLGVTQEGVRKWLEGVGFPDTKRLPEIAEKISVNAQWLLTGAGSPNPSSETKEPPTEPSPQWVKVPILSWEDAGKWDKIIPDLSLGNIKEWTWADTEVGPNSYALFILGDNMLPRYEPGSILIIDPDYQPSHKHIVIYRTNNIGVTCNQLIIDGANKYLKSHNSNHPSYLLRKTDKYCGSIRQVRMKY